MLKVLLGMVLGAGALFVLLVIAGSNAPADPPGTEGCVQRGLRYYQEIGSYPRLSDGRSAMQVVLERCNRSLNAF